jgi:arginase
MKTSLQLIAAPFHSGRRGVAMGQGPLALLERHDLAGRLRARGYEVGADEIPEPELEDREIGRSFEIARLVAGAARAAIAAGRVPVVLSGNCNSALGTTAAVDSERLGVLWFDAHADFDVPDDNLSGFFDVMALSTLTGGCWAALRRTIPGFREIAESDVVLVGVRDLESYQRERLERSSIGVAYGGERDQLAFEQPALELVEALAARVDALYVHVDFDSLDDSYGAANEYASPFGLRVEQLARVAAAASARLPVPALAFTAYDPTLDEGGRFAAVALRAIEEVVQAAVPPGTAQADRGSRRPTA